jgi:phosphoribosylformylglycinamidine (FGAM) synthase-like enzyme
VEVEPDKYNAFAKLMLNLPFGQIGKVTEDKKLVIKSEYGKTIIESDIKSLKDAWQRTFDW